MRYCYECGAEDYEHFDELGPVITIENGIIVEDPRRLTLYQCKRCKTVFKG